MPDPNGPAPSRTERLTRDTLDKLAYLVGVLLVVYGCVAPGREVAIGGGMSLIAGTVGAKALTRKDE